MACLLNVRWLPQIVVADLEFMVAHGELLVCLHPAVTYMSAGLLQVMAVVKSTEELKKRQATPDSAEALSCIPSLQLSDIPKEGGAIPTEVSKTAAGATLLTHDLFTNNVLYAETALPLGRVPARLLPLLPLFCRCDPPPAPYRLPASSR